MIFHRIKELRIDHDKTQSDIAKLIYTTQYQYSRWESGKFEIPLNILIMLSDYYNVSLDYLTGRTNNKEINK